MIKKSIIIMKNIISFLMLAHISVFCFWQMANATDTYDWDKYQWPEFKDMYIDSPLCKKQEITLWSCDTAKKSFTLCSSREITINTGYFQYRVSQAGKTIFQYPETLKPPISSFTFNSSPNGDAAIGFKNGKYEYVLLDALRGPSTITVSGKNINTTITCENNNATLQLNYTLKLMHNSKIWLNEH
ncbi:hypothetical protein [uncultured Tolumonas sp.]|uniref:hypothetical protein n=1 Tax=uncultured Tolumonas sp. TaxID=263765 RepID=UPI002A0A4828|nr:hypothetical protein [uncultured Tolumonas sp.]